MKSLFGCFKCGPKERVIRHSLTCKLFQLGYLTTDFDQRILDHNILGMLLHQILCFPVHHNIHYLKGAFRKQAFYRFLTSDVSMRHK